jgi:hypothetical protein
MPITTHLAFLAFPCQTIHNPDVKSISTQYRALTPFDAILNPLNTRLLRYLIISRMLLALFVPHRVTALWLSFLFDAWYLEFYVFLDITFFTKEIDKCSTTPSNVRISLSLQPHSFELARYSQTCQDEISIGAETPSSLNHSTNLPKVFL